MSIAPQNSLLGLPPELHHVVYKYLEPLDLLRLGRTCKATRDIAYQRGVWVSALKIVFSAHNVFEPTYPIESMSVEDLQRISTGPRRRFNRVINPTNPTTPWITRIRSTQLGEEKLTNRMFYLVPGGRYLFGFGGKAGSLWDLGAPTMGSSSNQYPHALDVLRLPSVLSIISSPVSCNHRFIRLALVVGDPARLQVYEVGPLPGVGSFRLVAELKAGTGEFVSNLYIHEDVLFFECHAPIPGTQTTGFRRIFVWDFVRSLATSWAYENSSYLPGPWVGLVLRSIAFSGVYVLFGNRGICSWKVPPLQNMERGGFLFQRVHLEAPTLHHYPHPQPILDPDSYAILTAKILPSPFATTDRVSGWVGTVNDIGDGAEVARYQLQISVDQDSGGAIPVYNFVSSFTERIGKMGEKHAIPFEINGATTPGFPDDPFLGLSVRHNTRSVVLFAMDRFSGRGMWVYNQLKSTDAPTPILTWTSCPMSGRVVYISQDRRRTRECMHILDLNP